MITKKFDWSNVKIILAAHEILNIKSITFPDREVSMSVSTNTSYEGSVQIWVDEMKALEEAVQQRNFFGGLTVEALEQLQAKEIKSLVYAPYNIETKQNYKGEQIPISKRNERRKKK